MTKKLLNCMQLLSFVLLCTGAFCQQTISGTVLDGNSDPLIGVNILVKGTGRGTVTDVDGKYSLQASRGEVLVFSIIGFTSQEITIADNNVINVLLVEGSALEEVVVVGYSTQRKVTVTGAVAQVQGEKLVKSPAVDMSNKVANRAMMVLQYPSGGQIRWATAAL
jgi:hypothetical protein